MAAQELGFDFCRIAPAGPAPHADFFAGWLERGNAADMHYLARNVDLRRNPARLGGDGAEFRSLIVLAVNYHQFDLPPAVRDDASLHDALRLMLDHQIKRLPVVDDAGRLLGLLGRGSLLSGLLATTDG